VTKQRVKLPVCS